MRIGIDLRGLSSAEETGIGLFTRELVLALVAEDTAHEWILFSNSFSQNAPLPLDQPNVTLVHSRTPNKIFQALITLGACTDRAARRGGAVDHWFSPTIQISRTDRATPLTTLVHDTTFLTNPEWYTQKQRLWHALARAKKQLAQSRTVLCPSESTRHDVVRFFGIPESKIVVVPPGVPQAARDFSIYSPAQKIVEQTRVRRTYHLPDHYFVYVGALEPRKNLAALLAAFESLPSTVHQSLVIIGAHGWNNQSLFSLLAASPRARSIRYLGYVPAADKAAIVSASTTAVYPSLYEGFGFPVLEALALGVPIVTSPRGSITEVTDTAALYAHPERPNDIAHNLEILAHDQTLRAKKIVQGLVQSRKFLWRQTAEHVLLAFER